MSYKSEFLEKHGWKLVSSKRRGMMRIERWWKSGHGTSNQEEAYRAERSSQAYAKLEEAKKDVVEAEAAMREEQAAASSTTLNAASNLGYQETAR